MLSLDDIEHGILRCNAVQPYALFPRFTSEDPRRYLSLKKMDARIHFALNCGAKSCPPVRIYTLSLLTFPFPSYFLFHHFAKKKENLENGLQKAAVLFIKENCKVEGNEISLSQIFKWYKNDFVSDFDGHIASEIHSEVKQVEQQSNTVPIFL